MTEIICHARRRIPEMGIHGGLLGTVPFDAIPTGCTVAEVSLAGKDEMAFWCHRCRCATVYRIVQEVAA